MTDFPLAATHNGEMVLRHPGSTLPLTCAADVAMAAPGERDASGEEAATLARVYRDHFAFVWRMVRRLGVPDPQIEDAVQDVFVVVHRRLPDFEGRSSVRTWLAAIVRRVARDYRRSIERKPALANTLDLAVDELSIEQGTPEDNALATEAARLLHLLLDTLDDDKREVFILAELEQWSIADIAEAIGVKVNTASSRLRLAREAFELAAERLRARDAWRLR
jgi:RNA polymerase sigma-70 factor (ECF subfamily)